MTTTCPMLWERMSGVTVDRDPHPQFTHCRGRRRAKPQPSVHVNCAQDFHAPRKIAVVVIIIVPGADITMIRMTNNARRMPGGINPALILQTGEAADLGGPTKTQHLPPPPSPSSSLPGRWIRAYSIACQDGVT